MKSGRASVDAIRPPSDLDNSLDSGGIFQNVMLVRELNAADSMPILPLNQHLQFHAGRPLRSR